MNKKLYPPIMLGAISYRDLDEETSSEITQLECDTLKNLSGFFEQVKDCLLLQKMALTPEIMVAHLCSYLGFLTISCYKIEEAMALKTEIVSFLTEQAKVAYDTFSKYPVNSEASPDKKTKNLESLRQNSPGSLIVQTIRLGRRLKDSLDELLRNRLSHIGVTRLKQTEFFCPFDEFNDLLEQATVQTQKDAHLPLLYVINQMTIQLGWLMGYYGHLDREFPQSYIEFGTGCFDLYIEYGHKLLTIKNQA